MNNNRSYLLISLLLLGAKATLALSEPDAAAKANLEKAAKDLGISVETKKSLDSSGERLHLCLGWAKRGDKDESLSRIKQCHSENNDAIFRVVKEDLLTFRQLVGPSSPTLASLLEPVVNAEVTRCKWKENLKNQSSRLPGFLGDWSRGLKKSMAIRKCEAWKEYDRRRYIDDAIKSEIASPILYEYTRCVAELNDPTSCQKRLVDDLRRYDKGGLAALKADQR